ncbi:MAG TPA: DtxR family transcriptional regulator [Nitrospirae bacterium]|nr:iron-dependent repressor IdeR [bacterium BMS3Abin08]HDO36902.1 DtxR family transcriptional regulator [Nitrospirota bacterium]
MEDISTERLEEALELLWVLNEENKDSLTLLKACSDDDEIDNVIEDLKNRKWVTVYADDLRFTEEGKKIARTIVRRHRLAERLFADVFEMKEEIIHEDACRMEHILSEELTDSVCTFLGHPPTCPHGKPIPRGECCRKYKTNVTPLVVRLIDFEVGRQGRITYIVPADPARLNRLNSIGIHAGSTIKLLQRWPSVVIQVDETTVAVDPDIAREIFIKKVS